VIKIVKIKKQLICNNECLNNDIKIEKINNVNNNIRLKSISLNKYKSIYSN